VKTILSHVIPQALSKRGLTPAQRTGLILGGVAIALTLVCCGGVAIVGALGGGDQTRPTGQDAAVAPVNPAAPAVPTTELPAPSEPTASPVVETKTVVETQQIPFQVRTVQDSSLAKGTTKVRTQGVPGVKTLTYQVTYVDGVETAKKLISEKVTKQPVTKVVAVGTKPPPTQRCDPNYTGACVPIASDVDCLGGSGNGPAYVRGPVYVVGTDIYDLDADNDGVGCE